ncbi:MAG: polysaccharide biosynthesis tyrosine autokinase [Bdellovibrionales bacterium]|nr:polysaccharide biosynthesis tyrosine autokinase [Bdellovibrionales bacterium]
MNDSSQSKELSSHIRPIPTHIAQQGAYVSNAPEAYTPQHEQRLVQDYLRILLQYRWLILSVSLIVLTATLLYSFLATPMYTAMARLKISTYAPSLAESGMEDAVRQQTRERDYLDTQIELLSGLSIAEQALQIGGLDQDLEGYFESKTGPLDLLKPLLASFKSSNRVDGADASGEQSYSFPVDRLERYLGLVDITPVRRTSLVEVKATTSDPSLSARLANTHAEAFINFVRSDRQSGTLANIKFLEQQASELATKVAQVERDLAAYAEENAIVSLNKDENIVVTRMAELSQMLTEATAKRIKSETALSEAKAGSALLSTSLDDQAIEQLRLSLKEAESEYAMLSSKFKPGYPKMTQLRARIDGLKKNLSEQRTQAVKGLEAQFNSDFEAEQALAKELEMQKSQAFELSRREVQYNIMKREYDSLKDLHQSILRQLKEAQVSSESEGSNVTLVDKAAVPTTHSSPKRLMNLLLALVCGPLLGFGLAILLEALDNTFKTQDEVENLLKLPSLGLVPAFSMIAAEPESLRQALPEVEPQPDDPTAPVPVSTTGATLPAITDENFVTVTAPRSIASESFRAIRTGILLSSADHPPRIILITSAKKGEGKTTLTSNLAVTLAQSGGRTVLVDADLRRPSVHGRFGIDATEPGLVEALTGQKELSQVVHQTQVERLSVIPAGTKPPNPAELIGSRKMAELLHRLAEEYDHVLVDTPPVLPVTDAVILSRVVDGVVLVVRGQETQKQVVKDAANRLQQVHARILGVVLNDVNVRSGNYYYYYRDTYSDYYADDKPERKRARA